MNFLKGLVCSVVLMAAALPASAVNLDVMYTFDSNGGAGVTVADDSGNGHTGTFNAPANFTTDSKFGSYGARLGATGNGYLNIAPIAVLPSQFTVAGFIKIDPATSVDRLQILFATTDGGSSGVYFGIDNRGCCGSSELIFGTYTGAYSEASGGNGSFAIDNQYHMIAAAVDRVTNTVQLFYDGAPLVTTGGINGAFDSTRPQHLNVWPGGNFFSNTTVDNFQIYTGLISAAQAQQINQFGAIVPEPSSLLLAMAGLAAVGGLRRRHRSA